MTSIRHVPPLQVGDVVVPVGHPELASFTPMVVDLSPDNLIAVVALRLPSGRVAEHSLRSVDLQRVTK